MNKIKVEIIMQNYTAVIIDTVSIQQYIFSSNKLKENIGASYIIEHLLYNEAMIKCLEECRKENIFKKVFTAWDGDEQTNEVPKDIGVLTGDYDAEIAYIGGGNAMVFVKEEKLVTDIYSGEFKDTKTYHFIKKYSLLLLKFYPSLKVAFGVNTNFVLDETSFRKNKKGTVEQLAHNKSFFSPNVSPFKHGIVEDCPQSNEAQEIFNDATKQSISNASDVKMKMAEKSQQVLVTKEYYGDQLLDKYIFTDQIDRLGQPDEKGYVAIVHVDGNGIGKKFVDCASLEDLRCLSKQVNEVSGRVMKRLIKHVVDIFDDNILTTEENFTLKIYGKGKNEKVSKWYNRKILPIRPLITAGDDFSFVCEGRLGVHLAEKLIAFINEEEIEFQDKKEKMSACAGVAIVKTHYPFYRAYQLAEELMKKAKKNAKTAEGNSWLGYMISSGGFAGDLNTIIAQQYTTPKNNLLRMDAYRVDAAPGNLHQLKQNIKKISIGDKDNKPWPVNKLMGLRDVLKQDEHQQKMFIAETTARDLYLPKYNNTDIHETLWTRMKDEHFDRTPYYDIIELKDFYPTQLLDK
ncbi:MAG: hypothetical protein ABIN97_01035 [Ginsengibacter sp.]